MKKRLLCYDEENPVGIDENGVLNPSALGGGEPDLVISSTKPIDFLNGHDLSDIYIKSGSIKNTLDKLIAGEDVSIVLENTWLYAGSYVYGERLKPVFVKFDNDGNMISTSFMLCSGNLCKAIRIRLNAPKNEVTSVEYINLSTTN